MRPRIEGSPLGSARHLGHDLEQHGFGMSLTSRAIIPRPKCSHLQSHRKPRHDLLHQPSISSASLHRGHPAQPRLGQLHVLHAAKCAVQHTPLVCAAHNHMDPSGEGSSETNTPHFADCVHQDGLPFDLEMHDVRPLSESLAGKSVQHDAHRLCDNCAIPPLPLGCIHPGRPRGED